MDKLKIKSTTTANYNKGDNKETKKGGKEDLMNKTTKNKKIQYNTIQDKLII